MISTNVISIHRIVTNLGGCGPDGGFSPANDGPGNGKYQKGNTIKAMEFITIKSLVAFILVVICQ